MRLRRKSAVALACVAQLALTGVAVADRISARVAGEEYLLRVAPFDPIDPFRGAYVDLTYPDLVSRDDFRPLPGSGDVFVPLSRQGSVWVGGAPTRSRPASGPYLACSDRDWRLRCGIESYFAPERKAIALERAVRDGTAVARVRIDGRGHAIVTAIETSP